MGDDDDVRRCPVQGCVGPDQRPRRLEGSWQVCRSCSTRGYHAVLGIPLRYASLRVMLKPGSVTSEKVGGGGFESSSPVRDAALHTMDTLSDWVITVDHEVREALRMTGAPGHLRVGRRVSVATANVAIQWDRMMPEPLATPMVHGASSVSRLADRVLGWDRLTHRLPAPCPYCDSLTLYRQDGQSEVRCGQCRRGWDEAEYKHFVRMLVEENS